MGKRMYYILKIIQDDPNKGITSYEIQKQLLEKYNIVENLKMIYKLIHRINEFFYEILNDDLICSKTNVGYFIHKDIFNDGQLQLLLDSITYHQDLRKTDKEELKEQLLKFSSSKQKSRLIFSHDEDKNISFSLFLNLNTIMKAIEEKKSISFEYINYKYETDHFIEVSVKNKDDEPYIISPYQIVLNNNHYYVLGYYPLRKNELSIYRIDRMRYILLSQKPFIEIREQFDMEEKIHKMMNMYSHKENIDLTIEFHQSILREVISKFSLNMQVEKKQFHWYQATIKDVALSDGLIGWIMMLQDNIKVLAPYTLKEEIKMRITRMKDLYQ